MLSRAQSRVSLWKTRPTCALSSALSKNDKGEAARATPAPPSQRKMTRATRRHPPPAPASLHDTLFRTAERRWKSRAAPPPLSLAFDPDTILWSAPEAVYGQQRGVWRNEETGKEVECWKVELGELGSSGMGQSRWKGKEREHDEVRDYAVVIPSFPGTFFVFRERSELR